MYDILLTWVHQIYVYIYIYIFQSHPFATANSYNAQILAKELATYDQLPEFSVELARLLKEGVDEKGRYLGGWRFPGSTTVLGDFCFGGSELNWLIWCREWSAQPSSFLFYLLVAKWDMKDLITTDGWNPASPGMYKTL